MKPIACALAAAAAFVSMPASAQMFEEITIENSTGYTINEVYIAPTSSNNWEEDVLDRDVLQDGQSFEINFRRAENTCNWDLRVVYDDGTDAIWDRVNLCKDWHFELFYNARSGDTHLTSSH